MGRFVRTNLEEASLVLGMFISHKHKNGRLRIDQQNYTMASLERFGMNDCKPAPTPGSGLELSVEPEGATFLDDMDTKTYQAVVGSIIYLIVCTRFDLGYSILILSKGMARPTTYPQGSRKANPTLLARIGGRGHHFLQWQLRNDYNAGGRGDQLRL